MLIDIRKQERQLTPCFSDWTDSLARKIFNADSGQLGNSLNLQQRQLLDSLRENNFNIIKSPRQMGVTTILLLNTAYNILYGQKDDKWPDEEGPTYSEAYIFSKEVHGKSYMERLEKILNLCDEPIFLVDKDQHSIKLKFRDAISIVRFVSEDLVRSGMNRCDAITVDLAAFVSDSTMELIPNYSRQFGCNVTIASTPRQDSGFFYELWKETIYGRGCFTPSSLKWYLDDRFNKNLQGTEGLAKYDVKNLGMICEAFEHGDYITNDWYNMRKKLLNGSHVSELDGDFTDRWKTN